VVSAPETVPRIRRNTKIGGTRYHLGKQSEFFHHAGEHVDACDVHEADINGA